MARLRRVPLELWKPELLWVVLISGQFLMVDIWHPLGSLLCNLLNHFRKLAILVVPFFSSLKSTLINIFVLHSAFKEFIKSVRINTVRWDSIDLWHKTPARHWEQDKAPVPKFTFWIYHPPYFSPLFPDGLNGSTVHLVDQIRNVGSNFGFSSFSIHS